MKNRISEFIILTFLGVFLLSTFFVGMAVADAEAPTHEAPGSGIAPTFTGLSVLEGGLTVLGAIYGQNWITVQSAYPTISLLQEGSMRGISLLFQGEEDEFYINSRNESVGANIDTLMTFNIVSKNAAIGTSPDTVNEGDKFRVGGDTKIDGNLNFTGELLPNGVTCGVDETIKKTGANTWDCAALDGGMPKGEILTLIKETIVSSVVDGETIDTAIDNVINTSIAEGNAIDTAISVAISSIGGHWSKVLDVNGNETNNIEYTAGSVEIGAMGDSTKNLKVNGYISPTNGAVLRNGASLIFSFLHSNGQNLPFGYIFPSHLYYADLSTDIVNLLLVGMLNSAYGDMMIAGNMGFSYPRKINDITFGEPPYNDAPPLKWFFNEIFLQKISVEEYLYNDAYDLVPSSTNATKNKIELPVLVQDNFEVSGVSDFRNSIFNSTGSPVVDGIKYDAPDDGGLPLTVNDNLTVSGRIEATGSAKAAGFGTYYKKTAADRLNMTGDTQTCDAGTVLISCSGYASTGIKSIQAFYAKDKNVGAQHIGLDHCEVTAMRTGTVRADAICLNPRIGTVIPQ